MKTQENLARELKEVDQKMEETYVGDMSDDEMYSAYIRHGLLEKRQQLIKELNDVALITA